MVFRPIPTAELERLCAPRPPKWEIGGLLKRTRTYYFSRARVAVASARLLNMAARWAADAGDYEDACKLSAQVADRLSAATIWRRLAKARYSRP